MGERTTEKEIRVPGGNQTFDLRHWATGIPGEPGRLSRFLYEVSHRGRHNVNVIQRDNAIINDSNSVMYPLERWYASCLATGEKTAEKEIDRRPRHESNFRPPWLLSYWNPWSVRSFIYALIQNVPLVCGLRLIICEMVYSNDNDENHIIDGNGWKPPGPTPSSWSKRQASCKANSVFVTRWCRRIR